MNTYVHQVPVEWLEWLRPLGKLDLEHQNLRVQIIPTSIPIGDLPVVNIAY